MKHQPIASRSAGDLILSIENAARRLVCKDQRMATVDDHPSIEPSLDFSFSSLFAFVLVIPRAL